MLLNQHFAEAVAVPYTVQARGCDQFGQREAELQVQRQQEVGQRRPQVELISQAADEQDPSRFPRW